MLIVVKSRSTLLQSHCGHRVSQVFQISQRTGIVVLAATRMVG